MFRKDNQEAFIGFLLVFVLAPVILIAGTVMKTYLGANCTEMYILAAASAFAGVIAMLAPKRRQLKA